MHKHPPVALLRGWGSAAGKADPCRQGIVLHKTGQGSWRQLLRQPGATLCSKGQVPQRLQPGQQHKAGQQQRQRHTDEATAATQQQTHGLRRTLKSLQGRQGQQGTEALQQAGAQGLGPHPSQTNGHQQQHATAALIGLTARLQQLEPAEQPQQIAAAGEQGAAIAQGGPRSPQQQHRCREPPEHRPGQRLLTQPEQQQQRQGNRYQRLQLTLQQQLQPQQPQAGQLQLQGQSQTVTSARACRQRCS